MTTTVSTSSGSLLHQTRPASAGLGGLADPRTRLADPRLRSDLARSVRRRIEAADVEDIVQATLMEALGSTALPKVPEEIRRFVFAIARQKVADWYRRREREQRRALGLPNAEPTQPIAPSMDLLDWATDELPREQTEAARTFEWMLREGEGESLADIAKSEAMPAPVVRQRVSRLRRYLRARWAEVAALGLIGIVIAAGVLFASGLFDRRAPDPAIAGPDPTPPAKTARHAPPRPAIMPTSTATPSLAPAPAPSPTVAPTPTPSPKPTMTTPAPTSKPPAHVAPPAKTASLFHVSPPAPTTTPPPPRIRLPRPDSANGDPLSPSQNAAFDRGAAARALGVATNDVSAVCGNATTPSGANHITITFAPNGLVSRAVVDAGPIVGRAEADCAVQRFLLVRVPAFAGNEVRVGKSFTIVPNGPIVPKRGF